MKNRALFRAKNFLSSLPFVILKRNPPFIYKTRGTNRVIDKRSFAKRGRGLTFRVGRRSFSKPHLRPANAIHISSYLRVIPSAPHGCLLLINSGCQPIWSIIPELFRRQCRIDDIEMRGNPSRKYRAPIDESSTIPLRFHQTIQPSILREGRATSAHDFRGKVNAKSGDRDDERSG